MKALSLRQAAEKIGVHPMTLRRWVQDGEGPRVLVKIGKMRATYRIMPRDLEDYIARNSRGGK